MLSGLQLTGQTLIRDLNHLAAYASYRIGTTPFREQSTTRRIVVNTSARFARPFS